MSAQPFWEHSFINLDAPSPFGAVPRRSLNYVLAFQKAQGLWILALAMVETRSFSVNKATT